MIRLSPIRSALTFSFLVMAGCASAPADPSLLDRIDRSLTRAADFLVEQQSESGAWFSETYGALREDPAITPHVLSCLYFLPGSANRAAYDRGVDYLAGLDDPETVYLVYLAAETSRIMGIAKRPQAQKAWLDLLRRHQMVGPLGWKPDDQDYGGWSYAVDPPRKGLRDPYAWANLSATMYGLGALRSARVPLKDPIYARILSFVERCQNFEADPKRRDERFDDGGFFFTPGPAINNKAGSAGRDRNGRERFHSYGSATADGLRCLLRAGLAPDHPRVRAARDWLARHPDIERNPGTFAEGCERLRRPTYFYYLWSLAHVLLHLPQDTPVAPAKLAEHLMRLQLKDGSWVNASGIAKEDDPLVATPLAASALAICRSLIGGTKRDLENCKRTGR